MPDLTAIFLVTASTIAASFGMVLFKLASKEEIKKLIFNKFFVFGGFLFVFGSILFILALKVEKLSVLFPLTSLTYIWVTLLSNYLLKEKINKWKIASVILIVIGILFVAQ